MSYAIEKDPIRRIHPKKFALWLGLVGIVMAFTALTSAYIVRRAAGDWLDFKLPVHFYVSTAFIILSSLSLHLSYKMFLSGNGKAYKMLLVLGSVLGLAFIIAQYSGWMYLFNRGITPQVNPSPGFLYLLTIIHAAHVLGGVVALILANVHAFSLPYEVTPARKLRYELTLTYWHFVDFLWIYILIFMLVQQ